MKSYLGGLYRVFDNELEFYMYVVKLSALVANKGLLKFIIQLDEFPLLFFRCEYYAPRWQRQIVMSLMIEFRKAMQIEDWPVVVFILKKLWDMGIPLLEWM